MAELQEGEIPDITARSLTLGQVGADRRGDELLSRLPLPLAQLYRRALNAKSPQDRHHNAYYLAEAALKLSACLRIGAVIDGGLDGGIDVGLDAGLEPGSPLARSLEALCLPSVGHWVGFLRETTLYLKARPDSALGPLAHAHERLLETRAFPAVQAFTDRAARAEGEESPAIAPEAARSASRGGVLGFFELIAAYRNQVFGHGAQRLAAFYEDLGPLLLAASAEILREECLFAGLTLAVARSRPDPAGRAARPDGSRIGWADGSRIEWQALVGSASLLLPEGGAGPEPTHSTARAGEVCFVGPGARVPLHPLVIYQEDRSERERVAFLNRSVLRGRGGPTEVRRVEYLDYATGDIVSGADARPALAELLARLRGRSAAVSDVDRVIEGNRADSVEASDAIEAAAGARSGAGGEAIGDFILEGELGRGGMGVVYRALQRSLSRRVALKVLPPALAADPVSLSRFRREIAALARADHPNLVKILTSGSDGDRHFYAMELVEGTDLSCLFEVLRKWKARSGRPLLESDLSAAISSSSELAEKRRKGDALAEVEKIEPGPPPAVGEGRALHERLAVLFADAAQALAHLHARGILHRDVKPGNLMITQEGARVVVMDLGLAQVRDRSQSLTRTGTRWVGTLRYTAPEQLQWNLLDVDERADVYGLGASLYELLTLSPLFDGDSEPRLIEQVLRQEPRSPRKLEPAVPRDLEAVVMGCLDKDRARRYANARDLAEDLDRFSRGIPVRVRPVSRTRRLGRWCRRNPALAAASGLAVLGLVAVAVVSVGFGLRAQYRMAESHLIRGQLLCERGEIDRGLHWMARAFEESPPGSGALRETIRMNLGGWRSQWTPPQAVVHTGADLFAMNFSPNSRRIAISDFKGTTLWSIEEGEREGLRFGHRSASVSFSRRGSRLLTLGDDALGKVSAKLWDLDTGGSREVPISEWSSVGVTCFSPDDRRIFIASTVGIAQIYSLETGEPLTKPLGHRAGLITARFSQDGRRILTLCAEGTVWLWESETGEPVLSPLRYEAKVNRAALNPDGKIILTGSDDRTARLWSAETGEPVGRPLGHERVVTGAGFSPDGKQALTVSGSRACLWSLETFEPLFPPLEHGDIVNDFAFSPDGQLILTASADHSARLWSAASGEPLGWPKRHGESVYFVEFSPDGKWMATMSEDAIKVWRVGTRSIGTRRFEQNDLWAVAFSPDGTKILSGDLAGRARLWSLDTGDALVAFTKQSDTLWTVAFTPDGRGIATGSSDGTVRFWSVETGEPLGLILQHPDQVRDVGFSRDGKKIATACFDHAARIWSAESGELLLGPLRHEDFVEDVAFSPDGRFILTGSGDGTARLWSVQAGEEVGRPVAHRGSILAVAFSPDGKLIATGSRDGTARLWSVDQRTPVGRPFSHPAWVEDLEFSPDGTLLVTGCVDRATRLWSVTSGHLAGPPLRKKGRVVSVAFSPDGKRLAGCGDSEIQVWDVFSPFTSDPAHVRLFTEAATGLEMDADGVFRWLEPAAWRERRERAAREEGRKQ